MRLTSKVRRVAIVLGALLVAVVAGEIGCAVRGQRYQSFSTPTPLAGTETLVLGFQGGRQRWDSESEGVRRLALKLRGMRLPGVHIETVENRKRKLALELIRNAFDRNQDGSLDNEERARARIILYGQSFGGAAVVKLARKLEERGIPVLLTVQVDSVGRGDGVIPANVRRAANLYQTEGWFVRGEREIRAQDSAWTEIIGNFHFVYRNKQIDMSGVPWYKKIFRIPHSKMNVDPAVWGKVEELILAELER